MSTGERSGGEGSAHADTFAAGLAATPVADEAPFAGRYRILGLLGAGGMGTVYRAHDQVLDEPVALKMLRPELAGAPDLLDRFRQEVKLARRITHTNVARIHDVGEHDGRRYFTMELVDGEPLSRIVAREGRMGTARALAFARPICVGLGAAHAAGVLHRDLKPDNVLVARDGRVVLSDFGVARALASPAVTGMPVGTPAYMAPEQVTGSAVDARADLFALGVLLFELVTGTLPFAGDSAIAVATARLSKPAPDVLARRADADPRLARLIGQLLEREPERRPSDAAAVSEALAGLAALAPSAAAAAPPLARPAVANPSQPPSVLASSPQPGRDDVTSLAVLPFRNAGAPDDDYLADGLTEELIDTLSMTAGLRVRSRGAVVHVRGSDRDPRLLGRELEVQAIVEGSLRRHGEALRVTARLAGVADGFQIWAQRFERDRSSVLEVADEAARAIAAALSARALPAPKAVDPRAADLYLQARFEHHKFTLISVRRAVELFDQAVGLAPHDGPLLSGRALALARLANLDLGGERSWLAEATAAAELAVRVAGQRSESHVARAQTTKISGDYLAMARALRAALALNPDVPEGHEMLGGVLIELDDRVAGLQHLDRAFALDPQLNYVHAQAATMHALDGEWAAAAERLDRLRGNPGIAGVTRARLTLWRRDAGAARQLLAERPAGGASLARAVASAACGQPVDEADRDFLARGASVGPPRRRSFFQQLTAELAASDGRVDEALAAIEIATDLALIDVAWLARCPALGALRGTPRLAALSARVGARAAELRAAL